MITPDQLMQDAINACVRGLSAGESPFGCAIALGDKILARTHNTVMRSTDITAHDAINALREANQAASSVDLPGAIVAATCEPFPTCRAALHWARVETVYDGTSIADAERAGFNELSLSAAQRLATGGASVKLVGGTLASKCRELFDRWLANRNGRPY